MRENKLSMIEAHVSTLVFDEQGNTILLLKRSQSRSLYRELWESTGGQVFVGETFVEAAKRIAIAEIGVEPEIRAVLGTYIIPAKDDSLRSTLIPGIRFLGVLNKRVIPNITISNQHSEYLFVEKNNLNNHHLIPTLDEDIEAGFSVFRELPISLLR
ncbi:MAG: NUDIX hydrolase [Sedimenticola sp.]